MAIITNTVRWADNTAELKANILQGIGTIDAMKASVDRTAASLGGQGLFLQANKVTAAIDQLGGVTKLTAAEQDRANTLLDKAIDKYKVMGMTVPAAMQAIADATRKVPPLEPPPAGPWDDTFARFTAGVTVANLLAGGIEKIGEAAVAAVSGVVTFYKQSVEVAAAYEQANARLTGAVIASGQAANGSLQYYKELAATIAETTTTSAKSALEMEARFIQLGGVGKEQMGAATQAALNLAAGLRIDLDTAVTMISKSLEGNITGLKRIGVQLDATRFQAEGANYVFEELNNRFGGQAQMQAETFGGLVQRVGNEWEQFQAVLGKTVTEDPVVEALLHRLTVQLNDLSDSTSKSGATFTDYAATAMENLVPMAGGWLVLAEKIKEEATEEDVANQVHAQTNALYEKMNGATMLAARQLPAITTGMKIWEEGQKALAKAQADLLALQQPLGDAAKAEIDHYHDLGLAAKDIASIMELNENVIEHQIEVRKQDAASMTEWEKQQAAGLLEATKLQDEYNTLKVEHGGTSTDAQIAQIHRWADDLAAKMQKAGSDTVEFYDNLAKVTAEKLAGVKVDWAALAAASKESLQQTYEKAQATYEAAQSSSLHFSSAAIQHFRDLRDAAREALFGIDTTTKSTFDSMNDAVMGIAGSFAGWNKGIMATTDSMHGMSVATAALTGDINSQAKSVETLAHAWITAADAKKQFDQGNTIDLATAAQDPLINEFLKEGWSLKNAEALKLSRQYGFTPQLYDDKGNPESTPSKGERVPGYATGVTNAPGGWALIGEDGPELLNVPRGANIVPNNQIGGFGGGGSRGGDTHVHFYGNVFADRRQFAKMVKGVMTDTHIGNRKVAAN